MSSLCWSRCFCLFVVTDCVCRTQLYTLCSELHLGKSHWRTFYRAQQYMEVAYWLVFFHICCVFMKGHMNVWFCYCFWPKLNDFMSGRVKKAIGIDLGHGRQQKKRELAWENMRLQLMDLERKCDGQYGGGSILRFSKGCVDMLCSWVWVRRWTQWEEETESYSLRILRYNKSLGLDGWGWWVVYKSACERICLCLWISQVQVKMITFFMLINIFHKCLCKLSSMFLSKYVFNFLSLQFGVMCLTLMTFSKSEINK